MSTHPNAILLCVLLPDDLVNKTYRAVLTELGKNPESYDDYFKIGDTDYHIGVQQESYDDSWQLSAPAGSIVVFKMVTYGYGEVIAWEQLVARQAELADWAKGICERHHCTASFAVTANYW